MTIRNKNAQYSFDVYGKIDVDGLLEEIENAKRIFNGAPMDLDIAYHAGMDQRESDYITMIFKPKG